MKRRRKIVLIVRVILLVLGLLALFLLTLGADIYLYSTISDSEPAGAAVVLGAAAWGSRPSPVFEQRIAHAVTLYRQKQAPLLIFTGGSGTPGQRAEALVASDYAIRQGVPARAAFCEISSRTTLENLVGAAELIEQKKIGRVLIVSDPLHMRRSVTMARDLGIDAYPSPTPTSRYISFDNKLDFLVREVYYYATYLIAKPFVALVSDRMNMTVQACR